MLHSRRKLPEQKRLTAVLNKIFNEKESFNGGLDVVRREPNLQGTFPKEIVTCRLGDNGEIQLFCKYQAGYNHNDHGHRGGVTLEVKVYQELLEPLDVSAPRLIGVFSDVERNEIWLIIEFLGESMRVNSTRDPDAMGLAARWIGQFHAACQDRIQTDSMSYLKSYDTDYFLNLVQRTLRYSDHLIQKHSWFETICERFEGAVAFLMSAPQTVIHGEYYPKNILYRDGTIYPVDWESAALAAGEIDLTSLTEGWPTETVSAVNAEYQSVRWPNGPPHDFDMTLVATKLYYNFKLLLHWMRYYPTRVENEPWIFEHMRGAGEELRLI